MRIFNIFKKKNEISDFWYEVESRYFYMPNTDIKINITASEALRIIHEYKTFKYLDAQDIFNQGFWKSNLDADIIEDFINYHKKGLFDNVITWIRDNDIAGHEEDEFEYSSNPTKSKSKEHLIHKSDETVNISILKKFEKFVQEKNHDNGNSRFEDDKFKHEYKYNPIRSLVSEYWRYSFGDPNDEEYYEYQYINLKLIHKGLPYNELKEKIKFNEPYDILTCIGGYYSVVGHGYSCYLNLIEYNDIFSKIMDKHQSLGSLLLDFLTNYLDYAKFYICKKSKDKFYAEYCKNYRFYIRDMNLSKETEAKYEIGKILHDTKDLAISDMIGKINKTHRFLIISTQLSGYRTDLGFKTFSIEKGHFKVIDKISHKGICQITLLHLPTDIWPIFENEDFDLNDMIEDSRRLFFVSFDSDIIEELESESWENYKSFAPGLYNTGEYINQFYTIRNSDGSYSARSVLDLKSKFIVSGQLVEYNYPLLKNNKFPAPKWLTFPELTCGSLGWRMGYGESYSDNFHTIRLNYELFNKFFPEPLNWSLKYSKQFNEHLKNKFSYGGETPYYAISWNKTGSAKYSFKNLKDRIKDKTYDTIDVLIKNGELIWIDEIFNHELLYHTFRINAKDFVDIVDAISSSRSNYEFDELNEDLKENVWNEVRYSVVLNLLYFRIMSDDEMIKKLIETGDRIILADSTVDDDFDYWAVNLNENELIGENNLGFALMELRDEINRIYKNNDKIDWFYTEFLNQVSSYKFKPYDDEEDTEIKVDFNNKQSPEYMVYQVTYVDCDLYVRDINLSEELEEKYHIGDLIQERAFVDMTDKIGQMTTSHRYAILSNHVSNLSEFEDGTNWGLHAASRNSIFKILDIYKFKGKTQILLLHLINGFEELFIDNDTIDDIEVEMAREIFEESFEEDIIEEVNTSNWLNRCNFPLGLDTEGNLWEIEKDDY